jgi:hypothetical protein
MRYAIQAFLQFDNNHDFQIKHHSRVWKHQTRHIKRFVS